MVVVFALLCVGAGCGGTQASVDSVGATTSTIVQAVDGIDEEFRRVGEDVLRARRDVPDLADPGIDPVLTHPVDVIEPGVYEMLAGPLGSEPDMAEMSTALPPQVTESFTFDTTGLMPELVVREDGELYLAMHLDVSEVQMPYYGLQAWFY